MLTKRIPPWQNGLPSVSRVSKGYISLHTSELARTHSTHSTFAHASSIHWCRSQLLLLLRRVAQLLPISTWLCGARECSMISTVVKPLSAQVSCFANQLARVSRRLPQQVSSYALAPLLFWEADFLLSEHRQASERQELAHKVDWFPRVRSGV